MNDSNILRSKVNKCIYFFQNLPKYRSDGISLINQIVAVEVQEPMIVFTHFQNDIQTLPIYLCKTADILKL